MLRKSESITGVKIMSSNTSYKLSQAEHIKALKGIEENLFRGLKPVESPTIVVIGGQPGAGKSGIITLSQNDFFPDQNVAIINGDEFRKYHPDSKQIFLNHDKDYASLTDPDVREWTKAIFDKAIKEKYNIIFEGTMRTEQICETIQNLKKKDYEVIVRVAAVNEFESRAAIYQRYENQLTQYGSGRFTSRNAHDESYTGMLTTLQRIEDKGLYDQLEVFKRNGELVYRSSKENLQLGVVESVIQSRNENWSIEKYNSYIKSSDELIKIMEKRGEKNEYINDVKQLKEDVFTQLNIHQIGQVPIVKDLPIKPHSKTLFAAYAKEVLAGQEWSERTNTAIADKMLRNKVSPDRVKVALGHSPEPIKDIYTFVKKLAKNLEIKSLQNSRSL